MNADIGKTLEAPTKHVNVSEEIFAFSSYLPYKR
jgi:hypothetical protein